MKRRSSPVGRTAWAELSWEPTLCQAGRQLPPPYGTAFG